MKQHKGPSQRQLRIGEEVRHALALFLQKHELLAPLPEQLMLSVSEVRMSPDLKLATCFVVPPHSAAADAPEKTAIAAALNRHAKYIRGQISHRLRNLRSMPELRFRLDTSFDNFAKIDALLRSPEVARDLQPNAKADDGALAAAPIYKNTHDS